MPNFFMNGYFIAFLIMLTMIAVMFLINYIDTHDFALEEFNDGTIIFYIFILILIFIVSLGAFIENA